MTVTYDHAMSRLYNASSLTVGAALGDIDCPDLPRRRTLRERVARYTADDDLHWFSGTQILHTDLNPGNVIVTDDHAYLVDWACPTAGPAWVDVAGWVICLITCGHTPSDAESWASRVPAWIGAPTEAVTAFIRSQAATWDDVARQNDNPWNRATAEAVKLWATHRSGSRWTQRPECGRHDGTRDRGADADHQPRLQAEFAGDEHALDLGGALADFEDL